MIELRTVPLHEEPHDLLDLGQMYPSLKPYYDALEAAGGIKRYPGTREPGRRMRLIASQIAAQDQWNQRLLATRSFGQHFGAAQGMGKWPGQPVGGNVLPAAASVVPDDIDPFITQQLLFVEDLYEQYDWLDIVTILPMTGPRAFIHSREFQRCEASEHYPAGSPLNEGLDPSYTECPTNCGTANQICVTIGSDTVEAECRRVGADYCMPAQWHLRDQYAMSLEGMLNNGMRIALRRDIQAEGLDRIRAGAGGTYDFSRTPPAGSYFETANPLEYQRTYWETIRQADMDIVRALDGRRGANILAGDTNSIQFLQELVPLDINHNLNAPRDGIARGVATEFQNFLGVMTPMRYATYLFPTMADDTMLVMVRDDAEPTFVWAPWIPFTDLGPLVYPKQAQVEMGIITLFGQVMVRPGRVREIRLTA